MADLRLARSELAEELRDAASLHSASQDSVEILAAGGDGDQVAPTRMELGRGSEAHRDQLCGCSSQSASARASHSKEERTSSENLVGLALRDALNGQERLLWSESDRLDRAESGVREFLAVSSRQSILLRASNTASARPFADLAGLVYRVANSKLTVSLEMVIAARYAWLSSSSCCDMVKVCCCACSMRAGADPSSRWRKEEEARRRSATRARRWRLLS